MATLYRKYRPQSFKEVLGQNHIKTTLENEIKSGSIAQAYLFCGPRAVGKTTMARILAKAINCIKLKNGESEPCNKCDICKNIDQGSNLEVIEIDAASHTGVDNVRENIIAAARVAPSTNKYKVFIIDEVHMLSISAFNALLKLVEEPPVHAVFILCTTEVHKVPATVVSRCQRFDFKRLSLADTVKKLQYIIDKEGLKADKKILETIARQANGYLRDAESLLGQVISLSGSKNITQQEALLILPNTDLGQAAAYLKSIAQKDAKTAIGLINELLNSGIDLKTYTADLILMLRKILMDKINPGFSQNLGLDYGQHLEKEIAEITADLDITRITETIETLIITQTELKNAQIAQLPLELATVKLCCHVNTEQPEINKGVQQTPKTKTTDINVATLKNNPTQTQPDIKKELPKAKLNDKLVSLQEIQSSWREFLIGIKKYNHSLSFILQNCQPQSITDNQLNLAFKYKFHRDRVNDPNIKTLIEQALIEVFKTNIKVETSLDANLKIGLNTISTNQQELKTEDKPDKLQNTEQKGAINNLLNAFGGEVIS